jgi:hypothetical protein
LSSSFCFGWEKEDKRKEEEENQKGEDDSLFSVLCVWARRKRSKELRREKNQEKEKSQKTVTGDPWGMIFIYLFFLKPGYKTRL